MDVQDETSSFIRTAVDADGVERREGRLLSLMGYTQQRNALTRGDDDAGSRRRQRRRRLRGPPQDQNAETEALPDLDLHDHQRYVDTKFVDITVSAFLAWRDLEERRGHILPQLPSLLQDCNFHWSMEIRDPKFSRVEAVRQVMDATHVHDQPISGNVDVSRLDQIHLEDEGLDQAASLSSLRSSQPQQLQPQQQHPFAVAGPLFSSVTKTVNALLGGGMGIPMISGQANSDALNGAPLFSRTVPSSQVQASAMMAYLKQQGITRVANLYYLDDPFGIEFNADLHDMAQDHGVTLQRFAMQRNRIQDTLLSLQQSDIRYVVAVLEDTDYRNVARAAYRQGIMGHANYVWFLLGLADIAHFHFAVPNNDPELAMALHGVGVVHLHLDQHAAFNVALNQFANSQPLQQQFLSMTQEPEAFENYTFGATNLLQQFQYYTYDAVIALGLAACQTPGSFTGHELQETLLGGLEFDGVSGHVSFDPTTGTRSSNSTIVHVNNIILSDDRSTSTQFQYESNLVATITGDQVLLLHKNPFVYSDNSTLAPPVFPTMTDHNYNLIPLGLQVLGLCLGGAVMMLSLGFIAWTIHNRNKFVVTASQPVFLVQLCIGTLIMALAIVPLSMQGEEPSPRLDAACTSTSWLFFVGLCTAISAILSKVWRLEQIMDGAKGFKRVTVEPLDVAKPFAVLLMWNVTMLSAWTVLAPNRYERIMVHNHDVYGRNVESYGACRSSDPSLSWLFWGLILAADLLGVLFACHKCYKVRHKSTYYADVNAMFWSAASLLETAIVFGPLVIAARDKPTADFLATSSMIGILCISFLLPIFLSKINRPDARYGDAQQEERRFKELTDLLEIMKEEAAACDEASDCSGRSRRGRLTILRLDVDSEGASIGSGSYRSQKSQQRSNRKISGAPSGYRESWTPQAA